MLWQGDASHDSQEAKAGVAPEQKVSQDGKDPQYDQECLDYIIEGAYIGVFTSALFDFVLHHDHGGPDDDDG